MRVDLEGFRAAGVPFDRAWKLAYERCKWPHHTGPKQEWKAILAAQRHQWRMAYDRQAPSVPVEATAKLRAA